MLFGSQTKPPRGAAAAPDGGFPGENHPGSPDFEGPAPEIQGMTPRNQVLAPEKEGMAPENQGPKPENEGKSPQNEGPSPENHPSAPEIQGILPFFDEKWQKGESEAEALRFSKVRKKGLRPLPFFPSDARPACATPPGNGQLSRQETRRSGVASPGHNRPQPPLKEPAHCNSIRSACSTCWKGCKPNPR